MAGIAPRPFSPAPPSIVRWGVRNEERKKRKWRERERERGEGKKTTDGMSLDGEMIWIRVDFSRQDRFSAGREPVRMYYEAARRTRSTLYGLSSGLFYSMATGYYTWRRETADVNANRLGVVQVVRPRPRRHCCGCRGSMHIPWTVTNHVLIRFNAEYITKDVARGIQPL